MIPSMDSRNREDILKYIRSVSKTYTPEWRFDPENPDPGAALAMIYADLFEGNIRRFNRIPERYRIAFYNELGAYIRPSVPAEGYACFTLAGDPEGGQQVRRGTQLTAETGSDSGYTVFETQEDVCVEKAEPVTAFAVSRKQDRIVCLYDQQGQEEPDPAQRSFRLFSFEGENLQKHRMYFCADHLLCIAKSAWITVLLNPHDTKEISAEILEALCDDRLAVWEYYTGDGWIPFAAKQAGADRIRLFKGGEQPAFASMERNGKESFWIRCTVFSVEPFAQLHLDSLGLSASCGELAADSVYSADADQDIHRFYAFGPSFSVFSEMYVACEEALCKAGADIRMEFSLYFVDVPLEYQEEPGEIRWKPVMKRSSIKLDQEFDVTVQQVIWEYYNGSGWAKLPGLRDSEDVFKVNPEAGDLEGIRRVTLSFVCPQDMERVLVNSQENYYIRARVIRVNNAYKTRGRYLSPVVEGLTFGYTYEDTPVLPAEVQMENGMAEDRAHRELLADPNRFFVPFQRIREEAAAVYLGFEQRPSGGPVRMLFQVKDTGGAAAGRLTWSFSGKRGFVPLNAADETEHLKRTGLVSFMAPEEMERMSLWGRDLYWIRIEDAEGTYEDPERPAAFPPVTGIYMNAVRIRNVESGKLEYFRVEPEAEEVSCRLLEGSVQDVSVEVLEEGRWVVWQEVEHISGDEENDRVYAVDRTLGIVRFSDGIHGKAQVSGAEDTIRVTYSTGGGLNGNLPEDSLGGARVSLGAVDRIYNPAILFGGCEEETVPQAMKRTAAALKHRGRGVTAGDYEALALAASRNVVRAKCFSGYNHLGERTPGAVTLVLLQKDPVACRDHFPQLVRQVEHSLKEKISGNLRERGQFFVTGPRFMEICVKAEVTVGSFQDVFPVQEQVKESLARFLDPLTGNFDKNGWEIGRLPDLTQLQNCLKRIPAIRYIGNIYVTVYTNAQTGRVEMDLEQAGQIAFALPVSGVHEVSVRVDEGR